MLSIFESNKEWVEMYYSQGFYQYISSFLRWINKWIPFSIGDLIYCLLVVYLIFNFFRFIYRIKVSISKINYIKKVLVGVANRFLFLLIVFKMFWGLNYSRQGIVKQLNLEQENYTKEELVTLIENFIDSANFYRSQISDTALPILTTKESFEIAKAAYSNASLFYSFLNYRNPIVKGSLFSVAGNYLGFTGYYNPFTGEAQVRTDIPQIMLPFIACHEIAHQIGYASEDEANFVAFLIAEKSNNIYLKYSMCLEILDYALNDLVNMYLKKADTIKGCNMRFKLVDCFKPQVKKDRKTIKIFFAKNKKKMSNISTDVYDKYLKANNQEFGVESYSKVVNLMIVYNKSKM